MSQRTESVSSLDTQTADQKLLSDNLDNDLTTDRWYHGRLDRYTAEERLWQAVKMGSYLVRESDRKPGSYVLSYLGRTGINHFRLVYISYSVSLMDTQTFFNCLLLTMTLQYEEKHLKNYYHFLSIIFNVFSHH
jgi:hypothetical protein